MQTNGKRDYKHAYKLQKKTGETEDQLERQRARRKYDKEGIDRKGKHIDHVKPLKSGVNQPQVICGYEALKQTCRTTKNNRRQTKGK